MLLTACAGTGAATRTPIAEADGEEGRPVVIARSYTLESRVLKETRRINVYLPPGYSEGQARLPVLYLLDGGVHEDFPHIVGIAQLASLNHAMGEMIVVGIEGTDRKRDFTHPSSDPVDLKELPTSGGSAAFREFLARELKPWVEARYRTTGASALIGESLAGLFVVETFLRQPELFERYIAVSPSLWWDNQSLAKESAARLRAHPEGPRSLFLSIGNEGGTMQEGVDALVGALKAHAPAGLRWHYEPMPGELHSTIYHPAAFRAVRLLFPVSQAEASGGP
ncbi:alpha/beta hydrolase [Myxococcus sp. RHSTA-1-4]|uniref:alpha/beta hydrolase n=1 Tax=Myxococcus sp. RHSTA-1-4 TaxID=2874601 RepID=UPI001CC16EC4|nr:alpha/beta hydrolase-fold protein [Myxococcus sp. RHSTA-1-4]MBZ4421512.1 alpha/beta hydrolase [Myxococcus sp. RHSTA-1-4]